MALSGQPTVLGFPLSASGKADGVGAHLGRLSIRDHLAPLPNLTSLFLARFGVVFVWLIPYIFTRVLYHTKGCDVNTMVK